MGSEVARVQDVDTLIKSFLLPRKGSFARLLPEHIDADTFLGLAGAAMYRNPELAGAALRHPESLLIALRDAARLGHEPGTDRYALTIRSGQIQGMEQYQGVIARMFNAGAVQSVHAEVICKGEHFTRRDPQPPLHDADWLNRDTRVENLAGAYAYAILDTGGCSQIVVMGRAEIMRHRAAAATMKIWDGPFGKSMWLKTVCHELEKWVPVSAEYRRQQAMRDASAPAVLPVATTTPPAAPPAAEDDEVAEGVIVDD